MKILLDQNLPQKLRFDFGEEHEVVTTDFMGWNGKRNGELLVLMANNKFDVFVTVDQHLEYQQNLDKVPTVVFVLRAYDNRHATLQPLARKVVEHLTNKTLNKLTIIEE